MNSFVRLTAIGAILVVTYAIARLAIQGLGDGADVFRKLMYAALMLLTCSSVFAFRQRASEWKDRPEKVRALSIARLLLALLLLILVGLAFAIFG
jgi:amino acid transporter